VGLASHYNAITPPTGCFVWADSINNPGDDVSLGVTGDALCTSLPVVLECFGSGSASCGYCVLLGFFMGIGDSEASLIPG